MMEAWYFWINIAWIGVAVVTFVVLFFITAPYGRHTRSGWGPMIPNKLGWILMELPSPLILSFFFFTGPLEKTLTSYVIWGLWILHYVNRSIIYPLRTKTKGKKMPLSITFSSILFNTVNASLMGYYLGYILTYSDDWLWSPYFLVGLAVFITGMVINISSDNILLNLRKPGETDYKIPKGGLFALVSCPNLFGEIIEWFGYAILSWSLPGLAFAAWTAANLIPRALDHHKFYRENFDNYPTSRKAVIPYLL